MAKRWRWVLTPLALLVVLSAPFAFTDLDLGVARFFYDDACHCFPYHTSPLVRLAYFRGTWPVWGATSIALAVMVGSIVLPRLRRHRAEAAFFLLVIVLGPLLIVEVLLKPNISRPRPRHVQEFGGERMFLRVGQIGETGSGKSYPSGHAAMGFMWLALGVFHAPEHRRRAVAYTAAGFAHGGAMGLGRIAQGGHFLGDVIGSALAVYLAILVGLVIQDLGARFSPLGESAVVSE